MIPARPVRYTDLPARTRKAVDADLKGSAPARAPGRTQRGEVLPVRLRCRTCRAIFTALAAATRHQDDHRHRIIELVLEPILTYPPTRTGADG